MTMNSNMLDIDDVDHIGEYLKRLRMVSGLSTSDLSKLCGVSAASIETIEKGSKRNRFMLGKLCSYFNIVPSNIERLIDDRKPAKLF